MGVQLQYSEYKEDRVYGTEDLCSTLPWPVNFLKLDLQVGISIILISEIKL